MINSQNRELVEDIELTRKMLADMRLAVREALLAHKSAGHAIVVCEDGQLKRIQAEEIVIPELDELTDL